MAADPEATTRLYVVLGTEEQPQLVRWTTWWQSPGSWDSYAFPSADGPVAIDPTAMSEEAEARLLGLLGGPPKAIVLTNDWHERDSYALRERWGAPVWAPAAGDPARGGGFEGTPDRLYEDGDTLPGGFHAVKIAGAFPGDGVLWWTAPGGERVLFTGDALNGAFNGENPAGPHSRRGQPGLYVGAGPFYLDRFDPAAFKESLRPLVSERIDLLCGAHGDPWRDDPSGSLRRLLEQDWTADLAAKRHPVVRAVAP